MEQKERIYDLADTLVELQERKDALDAELKTVKAEIEKVELSLFDEIDKTNTDHLSYNGRNFKQDIKMRYNLIKEYKKEVYALVQDTLQKDNPDEWDEIWDEMLTVNASTLVKWVKEQTETYKAELPANEKINCKILPSLKDFFTIYPELGIKIGKAKESKKPKN